MKILLLLSLASAASLCTAAEKPNIVFIMSDDQGYGDASSYNTESKIPTPGIDRKEQNNLVEEKPDIATELTKLLETAIANGRTTPGSPQNNDAKVVVWKGGARGNKNRKKG